MNSGDVAAPDPGIAIIAMACRFPGADDLQSFWHNLQAGVESIRFFSAEELREAGVDPAALDHPRYVRANPVLTEVEGFDAAFFGFSPREAEILDPQQRLFLECAWEAIEAAGYQPETYPGAFGVYAGAGLNTYLLNNLYPHRERMQAMSGFEVMLGNDKDFLATRVAYKLNLKGPALTVQTACSTSLVAVHLAVQGLLSGECDAALAGGVSVRVPQTTGYWYQEGMIASPDGHCRAFDAQAQGTVGGNGAGVVVLKRLADALADADPIYAVIKGSAINNDGSAKLGYAAPGMDGQEAVVREALAVAGVDPDTLGYVETHGTGTALGDPIEIQALSRVFRACTNRRQFCAIGSVKTNFGHLDTAAGIAGLIKAVLALHHGQIPPSLHYRRPNPEIDFTGSPFYVNTALSPWRQSPRRAGVSSFGMGGTNAHVVLEEAPLGEASGPSRAYQLLLLSARSDPALESTAAKLATHLEYRPELGLADVAYTLSTGRKPFGHRRMLLCRDREEAISGLRQACPASHTEGGERPVAFLFSGQGSQYLDMGHALYRSEPKFRQPLDACAEALTPRLGLDLRRLLYPGEGDRLEAERILSETCYTQPALFAVDYALARLWISWGIRPQALLGHSLGEYVAACLAGVLSLEDALTLVAVRGGLMQQMPEGAMLAVSLTEAELGKLLVGDLSLAAVNGPGRCVAAGSIAGIAALRQRLERQGVACLPLASSRAFHSGMMAPILAPFAEQVAKIQLRPPSMPYLSNLTGTWITPEQTTDPSYWAEHLRRTVRFGDGLQVLLREPQRLFLEVGPGRVLANLVQAHPDRGPRHQALASLPHAREQRDEEARLMDTLGRLWLSGVSVDWREFYTRQRRRRLVLPTYPFEHRRYWIDPPKPKATTPAIPPKHKRADPGDWCYLPYWKPSLLPASDLDRSSWLVFIDGGGLGERLSARLRQRGQEVIDVVATPEFSQLDAHNFGLNPGRRTDYDTLLGALGQRAQSLTHVAHLWCVSAPDPQASLLDRAAPAQALGFYSLMYLVQALGQARLTQPLRLGVLSSHMQDFNGTPPLCPEKATVLGPITVIPQEYPHIACSSIDIDSTDGEDEQLLAELCARVSESVVAYRNRRRWVQAYEPVPIAAPAGRPRLREQGVYLITGGLGGIGLTLAEYLARTVQARLVLIGRRPPEDTRALGKLEALGAKLLVLQADVTVVEEMRSVLVRAEDRFGPLNGVIHAAGVAGGGILSLKTQEAAGRILAPKLSGSLALDTACGDRGLDFLVMCSSLSAVLGGFGQVDYCAANAFLDAFAQYRSARGRPTFSIAWDSWREIGMAASMAIPEELQRLRAQSLEQEGIAPAEGVAVFARALSAGLPRLLISTRDIQPRFEESKQIIAAALEHLISAREAKARHPRPQLNTVYLSPRSALERRLRDLWQEHLGFQGLGIDDDYFELGGDSLKGLSLVNQLQAELGEVVHVNALFEAPTIARLAAYLRTHYPQGIARLGGETIHVPAPVNNSALDESSLEVLRRQLPPLSPRTETGDKNSRAVFILAPPRTGSTLLRVILAGHPQLFAPPELALLSFDTLAERRAALAGQDPSLLEGPILAFKQLKGCTAGEAQAMMASLEARQSTTRQVYRELQALLDGRMLVDKSPHYVYDLEILKRAEAEFEQPLYIHLLRHPYGMIHSYEEAKMDLLLPAGARADLPFTRRQLAELLWLQSYRNLREFSTLVPEQRRYSVKFEDLVAQPRAITAGLCRFLGLDFQPAMLEPYREQEQRMSGGLHPGSRPLGDPKFHEHSGIEAQVAGRWRESYQVDFLSELTWELAEPMGYRRIEDRPEVINRIGPQTAPESEAVEALSDAEVDAALAALLAQRRPEQAECP